MLVLTDVQKVHLAVRPIDAAGNQAPVDGKPTWAAGGANPEILELVPSDDGLSCDVFTVGPLGTAQVQVNADADMGEGIVPIVGLLDIEVQASQAVSVAIDAGTPEPK